MDAFTVIDYFVGGLFLLVAIPVIMLGRRSEIHWALAALLINRGLENIVQGLGSTWDSAFLFYLEQGLEHAMLATFGYFAAAFAATFGGRTGRRAAVWVAILGAIYTIYALIPNFAYSFTGASTWGTAWGNAAGGPYEAWRLLCALWVLDTALIARQATVRRAGIVIASGMALYSAFEAGGSLMDPVCSFVAAKSCSSSVSGLEGVKLWFGGLTALVVLILWVVVARKGGERSHTLLKWVLAIAALNTLRRILVMSTEWRFAIEFDDWFSRGLVIAQPVLLMYGMLRFQIMGLDLKLRFTVKQSTILAIFVGFFVAVTQLTGALFEDWYGSSVIGVIATGLLFIAFVPLRRLAERISYAAVPHAKHPAVMDASGKEAIFLEQLEFAWANGTIDRQERQRLEKLRVRLDITTDASNALEMSLLEH